MDLEKIQENVIDAMSEIPEKWGSSEWNIVINIDDNTVSIDHNTCCYDECCADRRVILKGLYGFDTDGWFNYNEDADEYSTIDLENWKDNEVFSIAEISEWINI